MALPASGQISMLQMRTEAGTTGAFSLASMGNIFGVSYATNGTNSLMFTEFYGLTSGFVYPYNINSYQGDIVGEVVTTTWSHADSLAFTLASYTVWQKVNSGSWSVRQAGISSANTAWSDTTTQPGFDIYTRVQAIGTLGEKSPLDVDMDNSTTTPLPIYPPFAKTTTQDETPTTI